MGREISWQVWSVVREQGQDNGWEMESSKWTSGTGDLERSWGWDNAADQQIKGGLESIAGYAKVDQDPNGEEEDLVGSQSLLKTDTETSTKKITNRQDLDIDSEGSPHEASRARTLRSSENVGKLNGVFSTPVEELYGRDEAFQAYTSTHTLGTMLRAFGIDNAVFGWDDEAEDFTTPC